jgi:hypothetical protein
MGSMNRSDIPRIKFHSMDLKYLYKNIMALHTDKNISPETFLGFESVTVTVSVVRAINPPPPTHTHTHTHTQIAQIMC